MNEQESVMRNLIKQFPTLEGLLGSQDYAECAGCQSVLSPAAYFVDLLEFLNPDDDLVWNNFLAEWEHTHAGEAYPHTLKDAQGKPIKPMKPFDVLMKRRPDLEHVPLTCEATETVRPCIDMANEILEYLVAHGRLDKNTVHDPGHARSEELIAEPQHLIPKAYELLKDARYPLTLPFDLWLETVRRFFQHLDAPLAEAMETLCPTESLYDGAAAYDRAAVALESLGLSPGEVALLSSERSLGTWWELYGYDTAAAALDALAEVGGEPVPNAKLLSRRLQVTYRELAALVQTQFVNPALQPASFLPRLGMSFEDLRRLQRVPVGPLDTAAKQNEERELQRRIAATAKELGLEAATVQRQVTNARDTLDLGKILVLRDPDTGATFERTSLQFADGRPVSALALLKLNLFVRLWRKLGWSLDETDRALTVFAGDAGALDDASLLRKAMKTALLYCARTERLLTALPLGAMGRSKLLTFWADLPTQGPESLYARLFLNRAVLRNAPVFDDPLGHYLAAPGVPLKDHLPAVQGALGLTSDDLARLAADAQGRPPEEATEALEAEKLTLAGVSRLYRHTVLSRALQLTVPELLALKSLSGLDPFTPLKTGGAVGSLADDTIASQTLRFVEMAGRLRERRVKVAELDALFRHRYAADSKDRPRPEAALALTQKLAAGLRQLADEHTLPATVDEAWLLPRLGLLLPADLVAELLALCAGTAEHEVSTEQNSVLPANQIPAAAFAGESRLKVTYSAVRQSQRLAWRGHLTASKADALKATPMPTTEATAKLQALLERVRERSASGLATTMQRTLSLLQAGREYAVSLPETDATRQITAAALDHEPRLRVWHTTADGGVQHLVWRGPLSATRATELNALSTARTLSPLLDAVQKLILEERKALAQASIDALLDQAEFLIKSTPLPAPSAAVKEAIVAASAAWRDHPRARLAYDDETKVLQFSYRGVLSAGAQERLLGTLANPPAALTPLLNDVVEQAKDAVKKLRGAFPEWFGAGGGTAPVVLVEDARRSFAQAWLPFIVARARRQFVETALASDLGGDPALTLLLLGDARALHLTDQPGLPLREIFAEAGARPSPLTLDGYFQVPVAGAYRLSLAGLATADTGRIQLGEPAQTVVEKRAGQNPVESGAVELKGGAYVRCVVQVTAARSENVQVRIEGETLPIGPLDRLPLFSAITVERLRRARLALAQALRFVQSSGVSEAELRFAWDRSGDFADLSLSRLPLREGDPAAAPAPALLAMWKTLGQVAQLKTTLGTDAATVLALLTAPDAAVAWPLLGALLDCPAKKVGDVAARLGVAPPLRAATLLRLWVALGIVGRLGGRDERSIGGTVADVLRWVGPAPTHAIARDVRNAVKARVEAEAWPQVAQPIFDPLRRRQRDALVAFLVQREQLTGPEQLYELLLLDPLNEPVVQTSVMALAISSVQLFIQRCFLNLEPEVHPSALDAERWRWIQSFALWAGGRRIFHHAGNYLQPEFRDDKTHLFQELEGKLLQGNVTADLVEEAFHTYLQGLNEMARLELVTMYYEQHSDSRRNIVHLFGRTANSAPKFFYRRGQHGMWTPWEPVSVSIEGDHVAAIVWRGRLQLFWLTFLPSGGQSVAAKNADVQDVAKMKTSALVQNSRKVQLNWSEYFQGKWTARKFSKGEATLEFPVTAGFPADNSKIFIHASKKTDGKGGDGPVWVSLRVSDRKFIAYNDGDFDLIRPIEDWSVAFQLVSKLVPPKQRNFGYPDIPELPDSPYEVPSSPCPTKLAFAHPTKLAGSGGLSVSFKDTIITSLGKETSAEKVSHTILDNNADFKLLTCTHPEPFANAEIAPFEAPFFYEDDEAVFFVEPTLVESPPVSEWKSWGASVFEAVNVSMISGSGATVVSFHPYQDAAPDLTIDPIGPIAKNSVVAETDWVTNPSGTVSFDGRKIGRTGGQRETLADAVLRR